MSFTPVIPSDLPRRARKPTCLCAAVALLQLALFSTSIAQIQPAGEPVALTTTGSHLAPKWSPDGSRIAFTGDGYAGIFVVDVETGTVDTVTTEAAAGYGFSWSPDGRSLLARPARFDGPQRLDAVKIYHLDAQRAEILVDYGNDLLTLPKWSAAGGEVLLQRAASLQSISVGEPETGKAERTQPEWFATDAGLGKLEPGRSEVTPVAGLVDAPVLNLTTSPDGSRVAFEVLGGNMYSMRADGTGLTNLGRGHRPSWSADGEWLVYMRTEDDGHTFTSADLFAVRADGSDSSRLTHTPGRLEMNPSWSPDGTRIAFDDFLDGTIYLLPVSR